MSRFEETFERKAQTKVGVRKFYQLQTIGICKIGAKNVQKVCLFSVLFMATKEKKKGKRVFRLDVVCERERRGEFHNDLLNA